MGYGEEEFKWSDSECLERFVDWDSPACDGIDLAYLRQHGYARLKIGGADDRAPHREGNFPTPSGKCEFKSSLAANGNFVVAAFRQMYEEMQSGEPLDDVPDYVPPRESSATNQDLADRYPLNIVSPKSHGFLNSCYANMEQKIKGQGEQFVLINPLDAAPRGISDGNTVKVFNGRGEFEAAAKITEDVNAGLIVATVGYWHQLNRGTVNTISSAEFANMGHAPSFSDNLIEIERLSTILPATTKPAR